MKKALLSLAIGLITGFLFGSIAYTVYAGIPISSNFSPSFQLPLDDRTVMADTTARDAIPAIERFDGLMVYVVADNTIYQLQGGITNGDWVAITSGGGVVGENWEINGSGWLTPTSTIDVYIDGNSTTTGSVHIGSNTTGLNIREYDSGGGFIGSIISGDLSIPTVLDIPGGGIFMDNRIALLHNPDDVFGTLTNGFSPEIMLVASSSDAWTIGMTDGDDAILTFRPKYDEAWVYIDNNTGESPTTGGNLGMYGDLLVGRNATTTGSLSVGNDLTLTGALTDTLTINQPDSGIFIDDDSGNSLVVSTGTNRFLFDSPAVISGVRNLAVGLDAGDALTSGDDNTFVGYLAGSAGATSDANVAVGASSLGSDTAGTGNVAIGTGALARQTNADYNIAIGRSSMIDNRTGDYNVSIGYITSWQNLTGQGNTAIGSFANRYGNNTSTVAIGYGAGTGDSLYSNHEKNTFIGYNSGNGITTATQLTCLGYESCANSSLTGDNKITIGHYIDAPTPDDSMSIGNLLFGLGMTGVGSTISPNARLGVGTSTPQTDYRLTVDGDSYFDGDIYATGDVELNELAVNSDATIEGNVEATGYIQATDYITGKPSRKSPISMSTEFMSNNGNTFGEWLGNVYASGSIGAGGEDNHPGTIAIYDSTTAGGGYFIDISTVAIDLSGNESTEFVFQINQTTNTYCRFGFLDTFTNASSTDGLHFAVLGTNSLKAYACNNSTCTEADTDYTLSLNTWYSGLIETNSDATEATFTLYNSATGVELWSETITSNVPTGSNRKVGHGVSCFETTTGAAAKLMTLDYMNLYFNRNFTR